LGLRSLPLRKEYTDVVSRSKLAFLLGATIMLLKVLVSSGVALSITCGQPDADKHPNVGALVGTFDGQSAASFAWVIAKRTKCSAAWSSLDRDDFRFMIGPPQTMILKQELTLFTCMKGVFSEVAARGRLS
jgi:hypothetical protein